MKYLFTTFGTRLSLGLALCMTLSACESVPVWERGTLAKPEMAWSADSLEGQLLDHVYFSKEAASGGGKAAGGGCGCN